MSDTMISTTRMTRIDGGEATLVRVGPVSIELDEEDAAKLLHQLETTFTGKDAATLALDEIAKLAGCSEWEYPGQVVRDVAALKKLYDDSYKAREDYVDSLRRLTKCPGPMPLAQHLSELMGLKKYKESVAGSNKP